MWLNIIYNTNNARKFHHQPMIRRKHLLKNFLKGRNAADSRRKRNHFCFNGHRLYSDAQLKHRKIV